MANFRVKGKPWEVNGAVNVEDCTTAQEVMTKAKLDFQVSKCEMVAEMPMRNFSDEELDRINEDVRKGYAFIKGNKLYRTAPNCFTTYRTDYNIPLGAVKSKYTVVQNNVAFNFFDDAIGKDKAIWQTAGAWGNGERIFVSAKLPNNILVKGDPVDTYLVFTNSHNGSSGVKILFTPIRVVCQNTLNAAICGAQNYVTFRHTRQVHNKIAIAQEILGISKQYTEHTQKCYNHLHSIKMSDTDVQEYLCKQFMTEEELNKLFQYGGSYKGIVSRNWSAISAAEISMRKANQISDTWEYYHVGPGQAEIAGTAWGAMNAISGYFSNVDTSTEGLKLMDSILYGDKARKIQNATEVALNF